MLKATEESCPSSAQGLKLLVGVGSVRPKQRDVRAMVPLRNAFNSDTQMWPEHMYQVLCQVL